MREQVDVGRQLWYRKPAAWAEENRLCQRPLESYFPHFHAAARVDDSQWVYPHIYSCVSKVLFSATSLISVSSGSATLEKWAKASGGIKRNVLMCLSRVVGGCFRRVQSPRPSAGYESKQSRSVPRSTQSSPERSTHPLALNCPQMVDSEHKSSVCLKQCWCNSSYRRMLTQSGLPRGRKLICRRERRKPNSLSEEPTCCSFDANIQKTVSKLRSEIFFF